MNKKIHSFLHTIRQRLFKGPRDYKQILLWIGLSITGLALLAVLTLGILIAVISIGLPDVRDLDKLSLAQSTTLYDRENHPLYVRYGNENREYVSYDKISPNVINAMIAIEDKNFWTHYGFNASSLVRAFLSNILNLKSEQGGSTITQQYVKNTYLSPEKSYIRKLKELILSIQLEQAFDKKKIIELYLNKIFYGNTAYGIEKAAQVYFNKHANDLDLAQSIILVAIPNRPRDFDPYGEGRFSRLAKNVDENSLKSRTIKGEQDLEESEIIRGLIGKKVDVGGGREIYLQGRTDRILTSMLAQKYINSAEKDAAWNEIQNIQFSEGQENLKAPHFVFYVLDQLEKKYGKEIVEQGGLKVYTTLDPNMQEIAEKAVKDGAESNAKKYNAKNAGLVAMDPQNGQIMAMVGSRGYNDPEIDGKENITLDYLQPGSSFKPFVYAQAFYNRFGPGTPVYDTPIVFGEGKPAKNFDGTFRGAMTIRSALGQSRNIPAIKAYYSAGEQKPIIDLTEKMGLHYYELSQDPNYDYGWPMAIGSAGITPLDMVTAYSVFANGGTHHDPVSILRVENAKGEVLEEWKDNPGEQALDPQVAFLINNILSDTTVRLSQNLTIPGQINAAKSGTSDMKDEKTGAYHPRDLWTMGYTTKLVTGVWTGNNKPKTEGPISIAADGSTVAAPIWKKFMTEALKNTSSEDFPMPSGIQQVEISTASGKLPGPDTPPDQIKKEYFASFSIPTEVDSGFTPVQIDKRNQLLVNSFCPPEVVSTAYYRTIEDLYMRPDWVKSAQTWIKAHTETPDDPSSLVYFGDPPTEESPLCTPQNFDQKPTITISNLQNGMLVPVGSHVKVEVQAHANLGISRVEFYLDKQFKYRTFTPPYGGEVRLPIGESAGLHHTITAKVFDQFEYSGEYTVDITTSAPSGP